MRDTDRQGVGEVSVGVSELRERRGPFVTTPAFTSGLSSEIPVDRIEWSVRPVALKPRPTYQVLNRPVSTCTKFEPG